MDRVCGLRTWRVAIQTAIVGISIPYACAVTPCLLRHSHAMARQLRVSLRRVRAAQSTMLRSCEPRRPPPKRRTRHTHHGHRAKLAVPDRGVGGGGGGVPGAGPTAGA
jgi:hypothetical protein